MDQSPGDYLGGFLVKVKRIEKSEWDSQDLKAFNSVYFNEPYPNETYHFTLLLCNEQDQPMLYFKVIESSKDICFVTFGGAFPDFRGKGLSYVSMSACVDYLLKGYKYIGYNCSNKNTPMIKFGAKKGFLIWGVRVSGKELLLEHSISRG